LSPGSSPPEESSGDSESDDDSEDETGNALPQWTGSKDLTDLMKISEVDEIGIALRDADKLDEVAKASVAKMSPDKLSEALTKTWTADQLRDLIKRVNEYLLTLTTTAPSSSYRRAPTQPTLS
jgi:hypothetical protein